MLQVYKKHPVTNEDVPDETAQVQELKYINPRKANRQKWILLWGIHHLLGIRVIRDALRKWIHQTLGSSI